MSLITDNNLVKVVYDERKNDHSIVAILNRFGGLSVFVHGPDNKIIHQCENILAARHWLAAKTKVSV